MANTLEQAFSEFRSRLELNPSFQRPISEHHNSVRDFLTSVDNSITTQLIGSLQRRTRIQPRQDDAFDIDILVILGNFNHWVEEGGVFPSTALHRVESYIARSTRYRKMGPETDSPAIVLEYTNNVSVELIPGYIDWIGCHRDGTPCLPKGRGYWIPKHNEWVLADYDHDAEYISRVNQNSEGYLIPAIKILKAIKRNCFPEMRSYHIEVLATNIIPGLVRYFRGSNIQITYERLICCFFEVAKNSICGGTLIPGSKSEPANLYMNDAAKQNLKRAFETITVHCKDVLLKSEEEKILLYRNLCGDPFPAYG